jgi:hypothetical protein
MEGHTLPLQVGHTERYHLGGTPDEGAKDFPMLPGIGQRMIVTTNNHEVFLSEMRKYLPNITLELGILLMWCGFNAQMSRWSRWKERG